MTQLRFPPERVASSAWDNSCQVDDHKEADMGEGNARHGRKKPKQLLVTNLGKPWEEGSRGSFGTFEGDDTRVGN